MKIGLLCGREYSFPPAFIPEESAEPFRPTAFAFALGARFILVLTGRQGPFHS